MSNGRERIVIVREREVVGIERDKSKEAWTTPAEIRNNLQQDGFLSLPASSTSRTEYIDCYEGSKFYKGLRPLFRSLRLNGLFFKRVETSDGKVVIGKWVVVCMFICLIMLGNSIRSLLVFKRGDPFDEVLFFKIQLSIWSFENFAKSTVMLSAALKKSLLPQFFKLWPEVCKDKEPDKFIRIIMKKTIMLSWNFTIVNTVGISVTFFLVPTLEELFLEASIPGAVESEYRLPYKVTMIVLVYFMSSVAMSSVSLLVVLSLALTREFQTLTKDFSSKISPQGCFKGDIEEYRLRHQGLCRLVDVLDDIFMVLVAAVLMSDIPMSCVILYNLIYASHHISILLLNIFWVTFLLVHMTVVAVACAYVNVGAHSPLAEIYNIRAEDLKDRHLELTMFLNKLTGSEIGLSALKMFVINRPAILTVFGMLITYFVLLLQFKSPSSNICTCSLNSSQVTWNGTMLST